MNTETPNKTDIFLLLALRQKARAASFAPALEETGVESDSSDSSVDTAEEDFQPLFEQLGEREASDFRRRLDEYQNKTEAEKESWRARLEASIGADEPFIDQSVHRSHIENALQKEIPLIRKIIHAALSEKENSTAAAQKGFFVEKTVRRAFAAQFVSLREIEDATAFDRLSGPQLARLIRLAGVREVAAACLRIEAVEAVAAFIRLFSTEDARMIAAHLSNAPEISEERIRFAENLVRAGLELETDRSAMLDWLGVWLTGILLCRSREERIRYTQQKLPLEFAGRLPALIEENCRQTPAEMQKVIGEEIERLARTIV